MRKKVICTVLSLLLCCSLFAGCSLIEHNDEKDAQQVIAVIDSIEDTYNGKTYKSDKRYIYKSDLISSLNMYAESYMNNNGYTLEQTTEALLEQLITRELLLIEAERLEYQGLIDWTQKDENDKLKNIYSAIDSRLTTLRGEIFSDYSESTSTETEDVSTETTYPVPEGNDTDADSEYYIYDAFGSVVKEEKKDSDGNPVYEQAVDGYGNPVFALATDENGNPLKDENGNSVYKPVYAKDKDGNPVPVMVPKYKEWKPEKVDYPCIWGTEDEQSLDREAVRRFIALIKELVANDFKVTKTDKELFAKDDAAIADVINTKGIEYVYPMLGTTHYMEYIVGASAKQSILIQKLQDYIVDSVMVTDDEITKEYQKQLQYQYNAYKNDQTAYQTAVKEGNTTLLYLRDDSYFYVKHILLPFSAEQTAYLTEYKNNPANADKDYTVMRDTQMVNETVVYPHVNGEDDKTDPKTVQQVFDEIYAAMSRVSGSLRDAERLFDAYTYKYNTDSGAFGTGKAYAVKRDDEEEHSGYMVEFYEGAMKLYNGTDERQYKEGEVLPEIVVTDYGVHIMYLAMKVRPGTVRGLDDYLTYGQYKTVRETLSETITSTKENNAFDTWAAERITYYQSNKNVVRKYPKRYKSLYEN